MRSGLLLLLLLALAATANDVPAQNSSGQIVREGPTKPNQLAIIADADGFVNVRKAAAADSTVVFRIDKNDFFLCEPSDTGWWRVQDMLGKEGFMHRSRIRLVKDLPDAEFQRVLNRKKIKDEVAGRDELYKLYQQQEEAKINAFKGRESPRRRLIGELDLDSDDATLYSDSQGDQFLYLAYYTDGELPTTLFFLKDPPDAVLERLLLFKEVGSEPATVEEKRRNISLFASHAPVIPDKHFQTVRGLKLSDGLEKVMKMYGEPGRKLRDGDVTVYQWDLPGNPIEYLFGLAPCHLFYTSERWDQIDESFRQGRKIELSPTEWSQFRGSIDDVALLQLASETMRGPTRLSASFGEGGYGITVRAYVLEERLVALEYNELGP